MVWLTCVRMLLQQLEVPRAEAPTYRMELHPQTITRPFNQPWPEMTMTSIHGTAVVSGLPPPVIHIMPAPQQPQPGVRRPTPRRRDHERPSSGSNTPRPVVSTQGPAVESGVEQQNDEQVPTDVPVPEQPQPAIRQPDPRARLRPDATGSLPTLRDGESHDPTEISRDERQSIREFVQQLTAPGQPRLDFRQPAPRTPSPPDTREFIDPTSDGQQSQGAMVAPRTQPPAPRRQRTGIQPQRIVREPDPRARSPPDTREFIEPMSDGQPQTPTRAERQPRAQDIRLLRPERTDHQPLSPVEVLIAAGVLTPSRFDDLIEAERRAEERQARRNARRIERGRQMERGRRIREPLEARARRTRLHEPENDDVTAEEATRITRIVRSAAEEVGTNRDPSVWAGQLMAAVLAALANTHGAPGMVAHFSPPVPERNVWLEYSERMWLQFRHEYHRMEIGLATGFSDPVMMWLHEVITQWHRRQVQNNNRN